MELNTSRAPVTDSAHNSSLPTGVGEPCCHQLVMAVHQALANALTLEEGASAMANLLAPEWMAGCTITLKNEEGELIKVASVESAAGDAQQTLEPIIVDGRPIGSLVFGAPEPAKFSHIVDTRSRELAVNTLRRSLVEALALAVLQRQQVQMRDDVLSILAHDLRNPLNVIGLVVSALRMSSGSADDFAARQLEKVERSVNRMNRVISDGVDAIRFENGNVTLSCREEKPVTLLESAISQVKMAVAEAADVELTFEVEPDLPTVWADKARVQQILFSLISFGCRMTPKGGKVTCRAAKGPSGVIFTVADTGYGVAPDELAVLFDMFKSNLKKHRKGQNLSMTVARKLVVAHGGELDASSVVGQGSVFSFTLPLRGER